MSKKINSPKATSPGRFIASKAVQHSSPSLDGKRPTFSFHHLHGDYCISGCTKDEKAAFAEKMRILSQQTWGQLRQASRHGLGYEKIDRGSLKTSVPKTITEDVDFIAFRFCGKAPMVGYKANDGTFHIVWFDRGFTLYDHS